MLEGIDIHDKEQKEIIEKRRKIQEANQIHMEQAGRHIKDMH